MRLILEKLSTKVVNSLFKRVGNTPTKLMFDADFGNHWGPGFQSPMVIKMFDGKEYKLNFNPENGFVLPHNGWEELANTYTIKKKGYLALFIYLGTSEFELVIFDKKIVERQHSSHTSGHKPVHFYRSIWKIHIFQKSCN